MYSDYHLEDEPRQPSQEIRSPLERDYVSKAAQLISDTAEVMPHIDVLGPKKVDGKKVDVRERRPLKVIPRGLLASKRVRFSTAVILIVEKKLF